MSQVHGHRCDRCGKTKLTEGHEGPREPRMDRYEATLPEGWIALFSHPDNLTLCKACQRKANLR